MNQQIDYHGWEVSNLGNTRNHNYWSSYQTIYQGNYGTYVSETWAWEYWWTGWYATSAWTPDASTILVGQAFTQTRNIRRDYYGRERSNYGNIRNDNTYVSSEYSTESQGATGTKPNTIPLMGSMTATPSTINFGQTFNVSATLTDPDGNLSRHGLLVNQNDGVGWRRPTGADYSWWNMDSATNWVSFSGPLSGVVSGSSSTLSGTFRPSTVGSMTAHSNGHDGISWASSNGSSTIYAYVTVNKTTPTWAGWANQTRTGTGTFPSAFTASVANPYSGAVAVPTGTITYLVSSASGAGAAPTSGAVNASTSFKPGSYQILASYPGDANYNATTLTVTFTVTNQNPTATLSANKTSAYRGEVVTLTVGTGDPDGNFSFANLWVLTPGSPGTYYRIAADGSLWPDAAWTAADHPVTSSTGTTTKNYTFPTGLGLGTYNFYVSTVDVTGAYVVVGPVSVAVVNSPPSVTATVTPSTINFGQSVTWSATATDSDGGLTALGVLTDWEGNGDTGEPYRKAPGVDYGPIGWTGYADDDASRGTWTTLPPTTAASGSSATKTGVYRPNRVTSSYLFATYANDGAASTGSMPTVAVNKAPPTGTFSNASKTPQGYATYTVQGGDLNATFVNPYSSAVTAPSGTLAYTIAPGSPNGTPGSSISAASSLPAGLTYTVRATYSGDTNYNTTTVDSSWTVPKGNQTITFANPGNQWINTAVPLTASSSSGLPITFSIISGGGSLSGATFTTPGTAVTVTLRATQAGTANTNPATQDATFQINVPAAPTVIGTRTGSGTIYANGTLNLRVVGSSTNSLLTRIGYRIVNPNATITSPIYDGPVPKTASITHDWSTTLSALGHYAIQAWAEDSVGQNTGWITAFEVDVVTSSYSQSVQAYSEPAPGLELWFTKSATVNATFTIQRP